MKMQDCELEYLRERNMAILLELERAQVDLNTARRELRQAKLYISRMNHPAGGGRK
jgi:cation transport regulator ChaC